MTSSHATHSPARILGLIRFPGWLGEQAVRILSRTCYLISLAVAAIYHGLNVFRWSRPMRVELVRQLYFTGARAVPFVILLGALFGLALVFQVFYWLELSGQEDLIGKIIVLSLMRELAPLMVGLILIGRTGMAIMAEVGAMRATGQIHLLEAQGIDPFLYILLPRAWGCALSGVVLSLILIATALGFGFVASNAFGVSQIPLYLFLQSVFSWTGSVDLALPVVKGFLFGIAVALVCVSRGFRVTGSITEIPRELPGTFMESLLAVFLLSGIISVLFL